MATPSSIGSKIGYDIKDKINTKYDDALAAAATRDVRTGSGDHVGKIKRHTGGIYVGGYHRISDCETTTTSATSRGVWSAGATGMAVAAATTAKRSGTNAIVGTFSGTAAIGDYFLFTCTTGYELDLNDMNFIGFWAEHDEDGNTMYDATGDLTIEMYDGTTKVYSYAVPAYAAATPHGTLFGAKATQWYFECPITSSEIVSGYSVSNITSIRIVKAITAGTNTKKISIDQLETYEISAGGYPFKNGIIVPMVDSGSGVTHGDWIELSDVVTGTVKKASTNSGTNMAGKACNTAAASGTVYTLIYGRTLAIADSDTAFAVGEGIALTTAASALCEDVATIGIGNWIAKALETATTDLDMAVVMISPNPSGKVA